MTHERLDSGFTPKSKHLIMDCRTREQVHNTVHDDLIVFVEQQGESWRRYLLYVYI